MRRSLQTILVRKVVILLLLTLGPAMMIILVCPRPIDADENGASGQGFPCLLSHRTLSGFWGIPWGAHRSDARQSALATPGVSIDPDSVALDEKDRPVDLSDVFGLIKAEYYLWQFDGRPVSVALYFTLKDSLLSSATLDFRADRRFAPRSKDDAQYLWRRVSEVLCDTFGYPDDPSPRLISSYKDKSYETYFRFDEDFKSAEWYFGCATISGDSLNFEAAITSELKVSDHGYSVSVTYRSAELDRLFEKEWKALVESKAGKPDDRPWWKRMWNFQN